MTLRNLLFELLDAGTDNLDTELIFYAESSEGSGELHAIEKNCCDVSINGNCIQLFMHD